MVLERARTAIGRIFGYDSGQVHINGPELKSSALSPRDTFQTKTLRQLNRHIRDKNAQAQLSLLEDINNNDQLARQIFESSELGIDSVKAVRTFRLLIETGTAEVKAAALETLFTYAKFKSGLLIRTDDKKKAHPAAQEILDSAQAFLLSTNDEEARSAASALASEAGYHVTSYRQKVKSNHDGDFSVDNNFMNQLYKHGGTGRLIHDLLDRTGLYAANQDLIATHYERADDESDPSMQEALNRENVAQAHKQEIMGWFGSMSSTNFQFHYRAANGTKVRYNLEEFITDAAKLGSKEACEKFIEHYTALIEYKEKLRARNPHNSYIKTLERQQTQALKFIFDANKLQAKKQAGKMIHAGIQREMQERGVSLFLSKLFSSIITPNELAEIKKVAIDFEKAFGYRLQYQDETGASKDVITMSDYNTAGRQYKAEYEKEITTLAQASGLVSFTKDAYQQRVQLIEDLAKRYANDPNTFKAEIERNFEAFKFDNSDVPSHVEEDVRSLKTQAKKHLIPNFTDTGSDFDVHIKSNGARNAIAYLKHTSVDDLSPEEKILADILHKDQIAQQKQRDGRSGETRSLVESLVSMHDDSSGTANVDATICAAQILLEKIEQRANLDPTDAGWISPTDQAKAEAYVKEKILGVSSGTHVAVQANIGDKLSGLNYRQDLIHSLVENIQYQAKDRFGEEIKIVLEKAVPGAEIDKLTSSMEKIEELRDNLYAIRATDDPVVRKRLTVANLKILGITNSDNPLAADFKQVFGTLADENNDPGLVDMFIETIRQIMDMIKAGMSAEKQKNAA